MHFLLLTYLDTRIILGKPFMIFVAFQSEIAGNSISACSPKGNSHGAFLALPSGDMLKSLFLNPEFFSFDMLYFSFSQERAGIASSTDFFFFLLYAFVEYCIVSHSKNLQTNRE